MDFKQLESFVYVVRLGSFSETAQELYLTQPTISAHIHSLERELGRQLIVRGSKSAYPTEAGKELYRYAVDILTLRDDAFSTLRGDGGQNHAVTIAASSIPSQYLLPKEMAVFRQNHPHISFRVLRGDSGGVIEQILAYKCELGFTGTKIDHPQCVFEELVEDRLVIITPNEEHYIQMGQNGFPLLELIKLPFILRELGSGTRRETERFLQSRGISLSDINVVSQMEDPEGIKHAVGRGLGVSIVSKMAAEDYQRFGVIRMFELDHDELRRKLYLVRHSQAPLSRAAVTFMDFIKERYRSQPQ